MSKPQEPTLLRKLRVKSGMTQADVASKAGISEVAVSFIERGITTKPRMVTAQILEGLFGKRINTLLKPA